MKKNVAKVLLGIVVIVVLMIISGCVYTVQPNQHVAVRQFGRIVKIESEPGLKFKTPFVQNIQRISSATTLYDVPLSDVITRDKKSMIADNYVLWKVGVKCYIFTNKCFTVIQNTNTCLLNNPWPKTS